MDETLTRIALRYLAACCGGSEYTSGARAIYTAINENFLKDVSDEDVLYFIYFLDYRQKSIIDKIMKLADVEHISSEAYINVFSYIFEINMYRGNDICTLTFFNYFKDIISQREELQCFCALHGLNISNEYDVKDEMVKQKIKTSNKSGFIALDKYSAKYLTENNWAQYRIPNTNGKTNYIRKNRFENLLNDKYHLYLMFGASDYDVYKSNNLMNVLKNDYKNGILTKDKMLTFITFFGDRVLDYELEQSINTMWTLDAHKILTERYLKISTCFVEITKNDNKEIISAIKKYADILKKSVLYPKSYEEFSKLNPEYVEKYPRSTRDNHSFGSIDTYLSNDGKTDIFAVEKNDEIIHNYLYSPKNCILQIFDRDWFRTIVDYYCNV